jgi:hypothetical protein
MLPNEKFALECRAYYDEIGLVVDKRNGQFAHCPYPEGMGETGYYLLWEHHQQQGLLQSRDLNRCCFFPADTLRWLKECDYFSNNFFELWDVYEQYASELGKTAALKTVELGVGVHGRSSEKMSEDGKKASKKAHEVKNEEGKSILAIKMGKSGGRKSVDNQSGVHSKEYMESEKAKEDSRKAGKRTAELKAGVHHPDFINSERKREVSRKGGATASSQVWESTVDGFRSNAAVVARHNKRNGWDPQSRVRIS